jgi:glucoamylase
MPLCWAHAEYLTLVRSHRDSAGFDCIPPVQERYARNKTQSRIEMWTFAHQPQRMRKGKTLRIITPAHATVHWSFDQWATQNDSETRGTGLGCWFADLPSAELAPGARISFTFRWSEKWEGRDFAVEIEWPGLLT